VLRFEWDARKARANIRKHGVSFEEASTVFGDSLTLTVPDDRFEEVRSLTIGRSHVGRTIVVAHTDRGDRIRIIRARVATARERRQYEQG